MHTGRWVCRWPLGRSFIHVHRGKQAARAAVDPTPSVRWVPVVIYERTVQLAHVAFLTKIRLDNAITTVAHWSPITSTRPIGATGYARLPRGWTVPTRFDLTKGVASITIDPVAVIALLTWV